jgi:hypothetical protein
MAIYTLILLATPLNPVPAFSANVQPCPNSGARVFLTAQGAVTLNGKGVEASTLKSALEALKPKPTVICYSRENAAGEPHPAMTVVMDAITSTRLPIGLFTDSTFKTAVKVQ